MFSVKENPVRKIEFSPPALVVDDIAAVTEVLRSGWITTGPVANALEREVAELSGAGGVVAMNSCTSALELALRLLKVAPGDEVIVPAYTFSATAAVVAHVGARIVMVDSDPHSFVPEVEGLLAAVTPRTKAIIPVDLAGVPYPIEHLIQGLRALGVGRPCLGLSIDDRPAVVVDAAHSLGATICGNGQASIADFTAFSFHAVKNVTTAEGGALAWRPGLASKDYELEPTVRRLILHGQTKDALSKQQAGGWEYDILEPGYKANMPDVLAALGLSQLRRYAAILQHRHNLMEQYRQELSGVVADVVGGEEERYQSVDHLAMARLWPSDAPCRDGLITDLAHRGIATNVHYKPLPLLKAYRDMGFDANRFPHAMAHYQREVTFPLHGRMSGEDVAYVTSTVRQLLAGLRSRSS